MTKNRRPVNIAIDLAMLIVIALVSVSGFILEVVIPSRHAVRMHGADSWCSHLCDWEDTVGAMFIYGQEWHCLFCLPYISCCI